MIQVFKIGGNVVDNETMLARFCEEFASVTGPKVLVHGGGVLASEVQKALGQQPVKIEGRRITDADTLKVVTMVYSGWCNKHIVSLLQSHGCNAIGLSGCDGNVITASRRAPRLLSDGVTLVDYGFVGDVTASSVNTSFLSSLLEEGIVPVLCAINHDGCGQLLNTNADTIASSVAAALKARLVYCFEYEGVLSDRNDPLSVIPRIGSADFRKMVADGTVADGMIPKIENCLKALSQGARGVVIRGSSDVGVEKGTVIVL